MPTAAKVFHDVISVRHAEKALEAGVDGLILVCAGAGGHAGMLSPFALVGEIRKFYDWPDCALRRHHQRQCRARRAGDGGGFCLHRHALHRDQGSQCGRSLQAGIVDSAAVDVVYTPYFTGVHGNYLKKSIVASGLDPDNLPEQGQNLDEFRRRHDGQGLERYLGRRAGRRHIDDVLSTAELVARMKAEYRSRQGRALCSNPF
jgi:nitronate monooxygenase